MICQKHLKNAHKIWYTQLTEKYDLQPIAHSLNRSSVCGGIDWFALLYWLSYIFGWGFHSGSLRTVLAEVRPALPGLQGWEGYFPCPPEGDVVTEVAEGRMEEHNLN